MAKVFGPAEAIKSVVRDPKSNKPCPSTKKGSRSKQPVNILCKVYDAQRTGKGVNCISMIPKEILNDCDRRIGIEVSEDIATTVHDLANVVENVFSKNSRSQSQRNTEIRKGIHVLKDIVDLLNVEGFQDALGCFKENKVVNAEMFDLFGGVQIVVDILLRMQSNPVSKRAKEADWRHVCLDTLHHMCLTLHIEIAIPLSKQDDLIFYLFSLMAEKTCFLRAATLLEDVLGVRKTMFKLEKIPNLHKLVESFDEEQMANFCRVLSIAMSDLDPGDDGNTLQEQDQAIRRKTGVPVSETNQGILIELPHFIKKIVRIAVKEIGGSVAPTLPEVFSELEGWVTWLDSSLAFDPLMDVDSETEGAMMDPFMDFQSLALPQSIKTMHELVYKVEVLYVLCLLLSGKQRNRVHGEVSTHKLMPGLNRLFDRVIWRCNLRPYPHARHSENCECSPEVALKIQFLRLIHTYCDHHHNKYLIMTRSEIHEITKLSCSIGVPVADEVKNINKSLLCTGKKGLLTKVIEAMKRASTESNFRFWLGRAVESFLRGKTSVVDQTFILRKKLLEHLVRHMIDNDIKSKEILQSSFDLLAELMKFNHKAFERFERCTSDDGLTRFMSMVNNNLVDSNMFIRCLLLTLEKIEREDVQYLEFALTKSRLLMHIHDRKTRVGFLQRLINIIHVEILTQENVSCLNTTIILLMFAHRSGELATYLGMLREEEQNNCRPGFILHNFRQLLFFWQEHYLHKDKDCSALEKSSNISFSVWKEMVSSLTSNDTTSPNTLAYYLKKDNLLDDDLTIDME
ncbi:short transient receptor potential channel 4-associated protein-like [Anneissia japonica]|uniref:short transient receptor potential channel 4-associated protein-like n=1 Tax=Anneissia japonica TaxID=1529436 RepID=UPI0014258F5B|nr:short transient receptor potential channel 4-associated protein-like [Anneissia japonica]